MALTSWKGTVVRKQDIYTAKNYLSKDELDPLNRLVTIFLESAEFRVKQQHTLTMDYWEKNVDQLLTSHDVPLLESKGERSHRQMEKQVEQIYLDFDARRKTFDAQLADEQEKNEMKELNDAEKVLTKRLNTFPPPAVVNQNSITSGFSRKSNKLIIRIPSSV
jgi:hypothetical protein